MSPHSKPSQQKLATAKEFEALLAEYPIVAAVNVESLPARQLQVMREKLRGDCTIRMAKRRVMQKAIRSVGKEGIQDLEPHLKGMPALLFTKQNPFALFKTVKANKSKAAAKAGQKAPFDIIVPAGPTSFAPGPIIGELGSVGIKSGVENGKIAIKQDSRVAKEGDVISAKLAALLVRLGIEPMEVGLDITAVYENGMIMTRSVLNVDEKEYESNIRLAVAQALAIALEADLLDEDTRELSVQRATREVAAIALAAGIAPDTLNLSEAERAYLDALTSGPAPAATTDTASASAPVAEEKEEKKEEEAAEGLGSLFG
jgi:large subunit ribosomal protein L10